ncbi:hypothetical protein COL40_16055 [Bacillus toyonensis]|uniref:GIY-YIG nuclease family protein n=1 Tax=Bacillus toyonensis TaxID=155322 RepID=UPI000BF2B2F4|nr:GIY-YIG nuclease family protein [Bacillus toyonensis]PFX87283.1 hypothetical protein COL40_16055 [Bacillus toyonensis]
MTEREIKVKYTEVNRISACEEKELEKYKQVGVYILRDKGEKVLYVGEAKNLSTRVKNHLNGINLATKDVREYIYYIDLFLLDTSENPTKRKILEIDLILESDPPFNSAFTKRHGNKTLVHKEKVAYIRSAPENYKLTKWTPYEKKAYYERTSIAFAVINNVLELLYDELDMLDIETTYAKYLISMEKHNKKNIDDVIKEATRIGQSTDVIGESLRPLIPLHRQSNFRDSDLKTTQTVIWWRRANPSDRMPAPGKTKNARRKKKKKK